jgi:hypothetical protein
MNVTAGRRVRTGSLLLCLVLLWLILLVTLGVSGMGERTSARLVLEQCQNLKLRDMAVDSAIEEACDRLESTFNSIIAAADDAPADLSPLLEWPGGGDSLVGTTYRFTPAKTEALMRTAGISFPDGITIRSSELLFQQPPVGDDGSPLAVEIGIFEFTMPVKLQPDVANRRWTITARRTVSTAPGVDGLSLALRIGSQDVYRMVNIL